MQGNKRIHKSAIAAIVLIILAVCVLAAIVVLSLQNLNAPNPGQLWERERERELERNPLGTLGTLAADFLTVPVSETADRLVDVRDDWPIREILLPAAVPTDNPWPHQTPTLSVEGTIAAAALRGARIYYCYVMQDGVWNIVIESIVADGTGPRQRVIPWGTHWPVILGFDATQEGNFLFLILEFREDGEAVFFAEYRAEEGRFRYRDISHQLTTGDGQFWASQAVFDLEGNLVLTAVIEGESILYIIGANGVRRGRIPLYPREEGQLVRTGDGRIFTQRHGTGNRGGVLMEIDMASGRAGNTFPFLAYGLWAREIHSAQGLSVFDLYFELEDEYGARRLYGYRLATEERIPLFTWEDKAIDPQPGDILRLLADGRIAIFRWWGEAEQKQTDLLILSS